MPKGDLDMDLPTPTGPTKVRRWLPYWAVFQADLRQTLRSWVYRVWVLASVLAATGYLLYRGGVYREAGMVQSASNLIGEFLRWSVLGSITLVIALSGGSISSDRGTMADSVLSRGISRYQYFLGKWHARLVAVLSTFLAMGIVTVAGSFFLLHDDLSLGGSLIAMASIVAILAAVTTCGVTVSAMANSTVLGITVLWIALYGAGFGLAFLPAHCLVPDRLLNNLPNILRGFYDPQAHGQLITWSTCGSLLISLVGMAYFSRRDV